MDSRIKKREPGERNKPRPTPISPSSLIRPNILNAVVSRAFSRIELHFDFDRSLVELRRVR